MFTSDPPRFVGIKPVVTDHLYSFVGYVLRKNGEEIDWVEDLGGNRGQCAFPFIFVLRDFVWSD